MALHIARVEIDNFRNFGALVIDPFPATAVVVGENNVGKTNLLYALRLILDPDLPDSARRLRAEDIFERSEGTAGAVMVRVAVELAGFGDDPRACATLADCLISDDPPRARLEYRFEPRTAVAVGDEAEDEDVASEELARELTAADYDWRLLGGPIGDPKPVRAEPRRYVGMRVLPALRDASDELTRRRSPLRDLLDRVSPAPDVLKGAAADVTAAMDMLLTDHAMGDLQTAIRLQTADMVGPALQVDPTLGIAPAVPEQLLRQIRLFTDVDRRRGLNDTSVGTANVLYLALLMEAVRQRRASNEHVTTILGVEEPEAHLHVQVQRRLFGYLLRHEPALLLTSHSPHIAAVSPLPSLVLLRATPQGSVATTTAHAGLSSQQRADLERYLDATRAELLFARLVVLVEGDAESYVVPALAHAAGFDLDEYGTSVVSVQGTDFTPFRRLLGPNGLNIPHVVISDGDRNVDPAPATSDGLARGLRLLHDTATAVSLLALFPEHPRRDGHQPLPPAAETEIRVELARNGIFIGDTTLEVDLARLLPDPFAKAAQDLLGTRAATDLQAGLNKLRDGQDARDHRDQFVGRIEAVGKGRFAQRLAEYLAAADLNHVRTALDHTHRTGYILQALDHASRLVRGHPLLDAPGESGNSPRPDDPRGATP